MSGSHKSYIKTQTPAIRYIVLGDYCSHCNGTHMIPPLYWWGPSIWRIHSNHFGIIGTAFYVEKYIQFRHAKVVQLFFGIFYIQGVLGLCATLAKMIMSPFLRILCSHCLWACQEYVHAPVGDSSLHYYENIGSHIAFYVAIFAFQAAFAP